MIERIASALNVESYCLFQNKAAEEGKLLSPVQRQEIINQISDAISKIFSKY